MPYIYLLRLVLVSVFGLLLNFKSIDAREKTIGLRNPNACGLYISSLVEDSEGIFKAKLKKDEIENYLRSDQAKEDLKPVLVFKDRKTWKLINDAGELEEALREGRAVPVLNTKTINLVGLSLTGRERRQMSRLVDALVAEQMADLEVRVRVLGRPEQPGLYAETEDGWIKVAEPIVDDHQNEGKSNQRYGIADYFDEHGDDPHITGYRIKGIKLRERFPLLGRLINAALPFRPRRQENIVAYTQSRIEESDPDTSLDVGWEKPLTYYFHRIVYFPPLPQDYQKFTREEISAGKTKLAINTPISIVSLSLTNPAAVVIPVTLTNFSFSAFTAAYSVVIANWFSRSPRDAHIERLAKNALLSTFFTVPLYWAGRGSLEAFSKILTAAGWGTFVMKKWSTVAFNILWRFFVSNGTYKWEQIVKEQADQLNREDFDSEEEYLAAKKELKDWARATRSRIETVASTIGTVGYLLAAVMPANFIPESAGIEYFQYGWGHLIMTALGGAGAVVYFKPELIDRLGLPERLLAFHEKITRMAGWVRATRVVQMLESRMTSYYSRRNEREAQEGHEFLGERDIREFFALDDRLSLMVEENPELIELIQDNSEIHRLLRRHPEYAANLIR